jgi:lysophospholipase L1-like esterase
MLADSELLWTLQPDSRLTLRNGEVVVNAVGLREQVLPSEPKTGPRVLLIGDSTVFGWKLPEGGHYADLLEVELREATGSEVQVINLGVPGYSTEQSLRLLERVGWSYEPDVVVVHSLFSDANIDTFQDADAMAIAGLSDRWWHRSAALCAGYMAKARWASDAGKLNRVEVPGRPVGPDRERQVEAIDGWLELSRVPVDDYLANLDTLLEASAAHGARLAVVPLAHQHDVGGGPRRSEPEEPRVLPWVPYRDAQAAWALDRGVVRLDLAPVFAAQPPRSRLFMDPVHPNRRGGQVMAETVSGLLLEQPGWL